VYIDAHCHLETATYGEELSAVIARAMDAGVSHFIAVGASCVLTGAEEAIALASRVPQVFATCGVHPHDAGLVTPSVVATLESLLHAPKVVALGEVGLDYYYDNVPRADQRSFFEETLRMANRVDLPIMLHIRDAHEDCLNILDQIGVPSAGGVIHCFTAGPQEAEAYLARGFFLSIPGVVTFKTAVSLREAVQMIPEDRILLETDCPYLAPVPYRGKRNEPSYLPATAAAIGALRGTTGKDVGMAASANTKRLFRLP
jgi:TatD DNase family protein